ncbi:MULTISPECIES: acetate kinase [unclassified Rhizobium]|uniref:acetate/propionate family kinase n=1 Tax=unclassified Rhizobium TaxID=2613769 RepID=UPI001A996AC4|nr:MULTISPECIES: acetate kinase [unclassified Rhizobium]MBX5160239.1 acetate kinase [Rhizobium sp. NZLR8]MBX5165484.1 acetate kinase [Rhizobium sp. NZLR4b]MBX5203768.1 acetate kinase [Rhizobium sp. NZLR1]MBX5209886.1 acetate kinase [Rhizobium sp. NZLR11]QSZ20220.1 acetate kinase [Rhizobium sp. NZLR1]
MDVILVVNAGSSSLKFEVFSVEGGLSKLLKGQMEGVGTAPRLRIKGTGSEMLADHQHSPSEVPDLPAAMRLVGDWLRERHQDRLVAVGHRVVHGGPDYDRAVLIDKTVLADLERYVPLAPLHQPNNLAPIRAIRQRRPDLPQVACFDTSFHRGHSAVADHYAIPERFYAEGVRRYGFHGLSYEYVANRLRELAPEIAGGRIVVAHLGSGASMCALLGGHSVESTFGFTALDGLPMGTRCGQIDPGVILYLLDQKGMKPDGVQDLLYKESGLMGLSGVSNDVRALLESRQSSAAFALEHFVHRIGLHAGMLAAALGGIDAFVFTAGIGENSPEMRKRIVAKLEWLGAKLDPERNAKGDLLISTPDSRLRVYVVPTDEELMIARHTLATTRT